MRISIRTDDGRVILFEDMGLDKYSVSIYAASTGFLKDDHTKKEDKLIKGLFIKKSDIKRLAKAS